MTKNLQSSPSSSPNLTYFKNWKWEKRHWLVVIGLTCLVLWWISPSLKSSPWFQNSIKWLLILGGLAFATDNVLKLTQ